MSVTVQSDTENKIPTMTIIKWLIFYIAYICFANPWKALLALTVYSLLFVGIVIVLRRVCSRRNR